MLNRGQLDWTGDLWVLNNVRGQIRIEIVQLENTDAPQRNYPYYGSRISTVGNQDDGVLTVLSELKIHSVADPSSKPKLIQILTDHLLLAELGVFNPIELPHHANTEQLAEALHLLGESIQVLHTDRWYQIPAVSGLGQDETLCWSFAALNARDTFYRRWNSDGYCETKCIREINDYVHPRASNAVPNHVSTETREFVINTVTAEPLNYVQLIKQIYK